MQKHLNKILLFVINILLLVIITLVIKDLDQKNKINNALSTLQEQTVTANLTQENPVVTPVPANPPVSASPVTPVTSAPKTPAVVATNPVLIKQNGSCGNANQTFSASTSGWGSHNFCDVGSPDPSNPKFPSTGNSASWKCIGQNGGATVSCRATRKS